MEIKINNELQELIPQLTPEEYHGLELNIINEGCRDALVLWNDILVDGHNRYEICTKHNIEFKTIQKEFKDIENVKLWIIDNQKSRRNLTEGWKYELSQLKKNILLELGKKTQGIRTDLLSTVDKKLDSHNTQKEIANELGWSTGKVGMADVVWKKASDEVKEKIKRGDSTFHEEYKKLTVHVGQSTGEYEWYTPKEYIEAAREVMGSIDLDPASCEFANNIVKAGKYYSESSDGLKQKWYGNVWLNPPYARGVIDTFVNKLIEELPDINQAIVIVNNATETQWMLQMLEKCQAICLVTGRVTFYSVEIGKGSSPLQGQIILYFGGNNSEKFIEVFSNFGICFKK